jgi:pseudaminic acid cytidylyltransferase
MNIAVIPERGGSKRIPGKNVKFFWGKPMIAHAIEAARHSNLFDHIVVSTDDKEIAQIAREFGAEIPFMRPAELADDFTPTVPVVAHAIRSCADLGWKIDRVCCLYPCSPLVQSDDLKGALELQKVSNSDYCFSVAEFSSAVQRSLKRDSNGVMQPVFPNNELTRTQDLDVTFYDAGQFYWGTSRAWLENTKIHSGGIGYIVPSWRVVDIDTLDDWKRAEIAFKVVHS